MLVLASGLFALLARMLLKRLVQARLLLVSLLVSLLVVTLLPVALMPVALLLVTLLVVSPLVSPMLARMLLPRLSSLVARLLRAILLAARVLGLGLGPLRAAPGCTASWIRHAASPGGSRREQPGARPQNAAPDYTASCIRKPRRTQPASGSRGTAPDSGGRDEHGCCLRACCPPALGNPLSQPPAVIIDRE